ncbi:YceI family protein [Tenacibaculum finnmarkense]|uniref:YceI family protein n=1 Tax=Tenacibaculum finnmarkense TaxID=2781243 RepID=UPI001EFB37D2|nr:YceI family protein [Tenacibaculum finnmarkense]MCG8236640.1 YceI family protein [Tenacibaculum finnmarkense genomovar ulcerans]MCG8762915.1 YceI family protein [Tenacibaculum finnmarkense]MCG8785559.1 YceI family protein [Tenacibaculum finnmarkense]MCG8788292.1 YceI family protein [Tenacibaculum finnmarkense]MCG8795565.1 YceI family protein [Tenacibaculum finnmarkense]
MKKSILAIALIAITAVSCKSEKNKVTANQEVKDIKKVENVINSYKANIAESTVTWKGNKPTGSHNGTVSITKGLFEIENNLLKSGEFVIDMNSILCADLEVADGKEKLENHLKGADFFDVEKFPTAKFEVSSSELKDGKLQVTGNLTLRGTTKSITIPATVTQNKGMATFKSAIFSIDRTDFGVTFKSKKIDAALKDKFINDLLEISFDIKAKK